MNTREESSRHFGPQAVNVLRFSLEQIDSIIEALKVLSYDDLKTQIR